MEINERKHAHKKSFTDMFVRMLFVRPNNRKQLFIDKPNVVCQTIASDTIKGEELSTRARSWTKFSILLRDRSQTERSRSWMTHLYICISIYMQTKRQVSSSEYENGCCRRKNGCPANSLGWWWQGLLPLLRVWWEMSLSLSVELYT